MACAVAGQQVKSLPFAFEAIEDGDHAVIDRVIPDHGVVKIDVDMVELETDSVACCKRSVHFEGHGVRLDRGVAVQGVMQGEKREVDSKIAVKA